MVRSRPIGVLLAIIALSTLELACGSKDSGSDQAAGDSGSFDPTKADYDGDGVTQFAVAADGGMVKKDCDDNDPDRFPGNEERCDFVDQDCDGVMNRPAADGCALSCDTSAGGCETPVDLVAGPAHTCALTDVGTVYCWGSNSHGQLGTAELTYSAYPVRVVGVANASAIVASDTRVCARVPSGALCWGGGLRVPVFSDVPNTAVQIATFGDFICWRTEAGSATCREILRAQGTDETVLSDGTLSKATEINAGAEHVCVSATSVKDGKEEFHARCWDKNTIAGRGTPAEIARARKGGLIATSSVSTLACAVADGELYCSEIGVLSAAHSLVSGNGEAVQVGIGGRHACARSKAGRVACWSGDLEGTLDDVVDLAVGDRHACVLRSDGSVACWGSRGDGALGDGQFDFTSATTPQVLRQGAPLDPDSRAPLLTPGALLGACDNVDDVRKIASGRHRRYDDCLSACDAMLDDTACRAACDESSRLSGECADCYTALEACAGAGCYEAFTRCAGFRADFLLGTQAYAPRTACRTIVNCFVGLPLGTECPDQSKCRSGACARLPIGAGEPVCVVPGATSCTEDSLTCTCDPERLAYCGGCGGDLLAPSTPNAFIVGTCYRRCESVHDCLSGEVCRLGMCQ